MNQENIYQLISILLEHKKYYNFKKLDKYFYLTGYFELSDEALFEFFNAFGRYVSTSYDYYVWTVCHEYLINKGLLHDDDHKHTLSQSELTIPSDLIDEIGKLLEGTGIDLMPYCQVKHTHLWFTKDILELDNVIESNVEWFI